MKYFLIFFVGSLVVSVFAEIAPNVLGDICSKCITSLCPEQSTLSLWSTIQPFCLPVKLSRAIEDKNEYSKRLLTNQYSWSVPNFLVGILCGFSSVTGIYIGSRLANKKFEYYFRFGEDNYVTSRFQIGHT